MIGFPYGATLTPVKLAEAEQVLKLGAREIEMVLDPGALKSGDLDAVYTEIRLLAELRTSCRMRLSRLSPRWRWSAKSKSSWSAHSPAWAALER